MNACGHQRRQRARRRQRDANRVDSESAGKISQDDSTGASGQTKRRHEFHEIVPDKYDIGALSRDVRSRSHRDAHRGGDECGRIVDAVADHGDTSLRREHLDARQLRFRQQVRLEIIDVQFTSDVLRRRS